MNNVLYKYYQINFKSFHNFVFRFIVFIGVYKIQRTFKSQFAACATTILYLK